MAFVSPRDGPEGVGGGTGLSETVFRPAYSRRALPAVVFVVVATVGVAMAGFAWFAAERTNHIKFEVLADDATSRIEARTEFSLSMIRSALAYFAAEHGDVGRAGFHRFVAGLGESSKKGGDATLGIQGIGYAPLIRVGQEGGPEQRIAANYGASIPIWPATDQKLRAPIVLLEPQDDRNRAALGYDMYADPRRRAAMTEAIDDAAARGTHRVELVQEIHGDKQAGFLVYLPFYADGDPQPSQASSRRQPQGFVYAPFRMGDLISSAMGKAPLLPVSLAVYDGEPEENRLLYRSPTEPSDRYSRSYEVSRTMIVAGRTWTILFRPTAGFVPSVLQLVAVVLGAVSLLLAGALAALAWSQQKAFDAVAALQTVAEKNLLEKDLLLQEMKHRIKNSIARVLAMARQTASSAHSLEDFSNSFAARLQAMATTQDMLTRSAWRQADLRALLIEELTPVFGRDLDDNLINGDPVALNESATQALGLTFHELATNALKYGAIGRGEGRLMIAWHFTRRDDRDHLVLEWREEGASIRRVPGPSGFGTRLIDASIRLELGGAIARDYAADGLCITLTIPKPNIEPEVGSGPLPGNAAPGFPSPAGPASGLLQAVRRVHARTRRRESQKG